MECKSLTLFPSRLSTLSKRLRAPTRQQIPERYSVASIYLSILPMYLPQHQHQKSWKTTKQCPAKDIPYPLSHLMAVSAASQLSAYGVSHILYMPGMCPSKHILGCIADCYISVYGVCLSKIVIWGVYQICPPPSVESRFHALLIVGVSPAPFAPDFRWSGHANSDLRAP